MSRSHPPKKGASPFSSENKASSDEGAPLRPPLSDRGEGHTYGADAARSLGAALGGQLRGFEYEAEHPEDVPEPLLAGDEVTELTGREPISEFSDTRQEMESPEDVLDRGEDYGRATALSVGEEEVGIFGPNDLRYGGEDISGVSEWSLRAHNLDLSDGLTEGDFLRSDRQILEEVLDLLPTVLGQTHQVEVSVTEGVVRLRGSVSTPREREEVTNMALTIYGVQEVEDSLSLRPSNSSSYRRKE